jgi:hypothetical protein
MLTHDGYNTLVGPIHVQLGAPYAARSRFSISRFLGYDKTGGRDYWWIGDAVVNQNGKITWTFREESEPVTDEELQTAKRGILSILQEGSQSWIDS